MKRGTIINKRNRGFFLVTILVAFYFTISNVLAANYKDSTHIIIKPVEGKKIDSIRVKIWDDYTAGAYSLATTQTISIQNNSAASFLLNTFRGQGTFTIQAFSGGETYNYSVQFPVANGDEVKIAIDRKKLDFKGKGAKKMELTYELYNLHERFRKQYYDADVQFKNPRFPGDTFWGATYGYLNKPLDSLLNEKIKYLDRFRSGLSNKDYLWLKANTICYDYFVRVNRFGKNKAYGLKVDSTKSTLFEELYNQNLKRLYPENIPDSVLIATTTFTDFLIDKWIQDRKFNKDFPKDYHEVLAYANSLPSVIKEHFVTSYLLLRGVNKLDSDFVNKALQFVKSSYYLSFFNALRKNTKLGNYAFDFSLENTNRKIVKLGDFKGKVVFMDFWFTGCQWCKIYYQQTLKKVEDYFKNSEDIVFLSICIDSNRQSWIKSIDEGVYTGPNSINLFTQGKGSNHPLIKYYNVSGYPTQIIIDSYMKNHNVDNGIQIKPADELIKYLESIIGK